MEIRPVAGEREERAFSQMEHYCFQGDMGQDMFPLRGGAVAWGAFEGDELHAGIIEVPYTVHVFGAPARMLGVGAVASLPEHRNQGAVRRLHEHVLQNGAASGYLVSALYPFSFGFYAKFGFGNVGPNVTNRFPPDHIALGRGPAAYAIVSPDPAAAAAEIDAWYARFWSSYDFSDAREAPALGELLAGAVDKGSYLRGCVDASGRLAGVILYSISAPVNWQRTLTVRRAAWRDGEAFRSLLGFLWSHRGQCATIEWSWPDGEFLAHALTEPRFDRRPNYSWSARPVDVRTILEHRARLERFDGRLAITLRDPAVPGNSGRYIIDGGTVAFEPTETEPDLPFDLFSSLLFGALSVDDVALLAPVPFDIAVAARLFRRRKRFITEHF